MLILHPLTYNLSVSDRTVNLSSLSAQNSAERTASKSILQAAVIVQQLVDRSAARFAHNLTSMSSICRINCFTLRVSLRWLIYWMTSPDGGAYISRQPSCHQSAKPSLLFDSFKNAVLIIKPHHSSNTVSVALHDMLQLSHPWWQWYAFLA